MIVYYAHCMAIYNTPQEERDIELLKELGFEVNNPNDKGHDYGWKTHGMKYADKIVPGADVVAFRSLPDGTIPAGIAYEVQLAIDKGIPIIELPNFHNRKVLDREQTRQYLREIGQR